MDKHVIVLDKPPGLATQGGCGLTKHVDGMLDSLQYEKPTRPKLVHRLDRDTSGVLLIARTAQAASGLSQALALRDTSKIYWALTKRRAETEARRGQGGAGQGRRPRPAWPRRAHGDVGRRRRGRQIRPHRICRDGHGGHGIRLGGGAAHHRAHPPDPRPSGQPGHAHRGRFQIWRHGCARAGRHRRQAASACPQHRYRPSRWRAAAGHRAAAAAHGEKLAAAGLRSRRPHAILFRPKRSQRRR